MRLGGNDLRHFATGAAFLGAGGGGDRYLGVVVRGGQCCRKPPVRFVPDEGTQIHQEVGVRFDHQNLLAANHHARKLMNHGELRLGQAFENRSPAARDTRMEQ